jgi:hypothetical protein
MVFASMAGAGGLLAAAQLGTSNLDQMISEEMGTTESMMKTAVQSANAALGTGTDVSFTVLAVAAMPVVFHLAKAGMAMIMAEHELSVAKRRKAHGLDRGPVE